MFEKGMIHKLYTILCSAIFVMFILVLVGLRYSSSEREKQSGYIMLNNVMQNEEVYTAKSSLGVSNIYIWNVANVSHSYSELMFYTLHQRVEVYIGETRIYRYEPSPKNLFGKTDGCAWHTISLRPEDNGQQLRVVLIPLYKGVVDIEPNFYFGIAADIINIQIKKNFPGIIFGIIAFFVGVIYMGYSIMQLWGTDEFRSMSMLSIFAMVLGIWKISDSSLMQMLFHNSISSTYIPYFMLMMLPLPMIAYIKEIFKDSENRIWYYLSIFVFSVSVFQLLTQMVNLYDLRESIWLTHLSLGSIALVSIIMVIHELMRTGLSKKAISSLIGMGFCVLGLVIDVIVYYVSQGAHSVMWGMLGFVVFIILLGIHSVKETKELVDAGRKAHKFEQIAYHDQMTGMFNRAAYSYDTTQEEFEPEGCIVVVFDLNNLKQCNDTLGHECGDKYITESSRLIQESFGRYGSVYRMGGDEFSCLLHGSTQDDVREMIEDLHLLEKKWNETSKDVRMQIACGFQKYDSRIDYDIADTARRADKQMYSDKIARKKQSAEQGE